MIKIASTKIPHIGELQAFLDNTDISSEINNFYEDVWTLHEGNLNFSLFDTLTRLNPALSKSFDADIKDIAKILCIGISRKQLRHWSLKCNFDLVATLFTYMFKSGINSVRPEDLKDFIEYYALSTVVGVEIIDRLSPRSGTVTLAVLTRLLSSNFALSLYGISPLLDSVAIHHVTNALSEAIDSISLGSLTYADWIHGGSFNFLPLEVGRYYIDYCDSIFEEHYEIAIALEKTMKDYKTLILESGLKYNNNTHNAFNTMLGGACTEITRNKKPFKKSKLTKLRSIINSRFNKYLIPEIQKRIMLGQESITKLASILGIDSTGVTYESDRKRLRYILEVYLLTSSKDIIIEIFNQSNFKLDIDGFLLKVEELRPSVSESEIPSSSYYEKVGVSSGYGRSIVNIFISLIKSAAMTNIVALTGWRASEFGFPISAISFEYNTDCLDQVDNPLRININWHVFKTNGDTKTTREISLGIYRKICHLASIISADDMSPCLYKSPERIHTQEHSASAVRTAVQKNWGFYVRYYKPFLVLDSFDSFSSGENIIGNINNDNLITKYNSGNIHGFNNDETDKIFNDISLYEARKIARDELARVEFSFKDGNLIEKKNYVLEYREFLNGRSSSIHANTRILLDTHLSTETIDAIRIASDDTINNSVFTKDVRNDLISGCIYPTPHALRHMWAEAVFFRFDGDGGRMIRANFKHISPSMWTRYGIGKNQNNQRDRLKFKFVSFLLKDWIRTKGHGYGGKFNKTLIRITNSTRFINSSDPKSLLDMLASNEVESAKANPWGFCLPRRHTSHLSQCAIDGLPATRNASPELCLPCIHCLTKTSHVDYIIFHSYPHIDFLESKTLIDIPDFLYDESRNFIIAAVKAIKELQPDNIIIPRMLAAIALHTQNLS